jgi:hypothetical protein
MNRNLLGWGKKQLLLINELLAMFKIIVESEWHNENCEPKQ